ncbi:MAG: hypothetical protein ACSLFQ_15520 [Thermoanaerobaculia bacterium]
MRNRESGNATLVVLIMLAMICVAWTVSAAEPAKPASQTTQQQPAMPVGTTVPAPIQKLECVVQGSPTEFPDDIHLTNAGNVKLEKGTKISWALPNTTRKGTYTLAADVAPGSGVFMSGVLGGGHPAGAVCTCSVAASRMMSPVQPGSMRPVLRYSLDCTVQGTPTEFPDDVYIFNKGTVAVAKGKVLHWSIPNTTRAGDYTLTEELAAGKGVFVSGAVGGGMSAGVKCGVTVK